MEEGGGGVGWEGGALRRGVTEGEMEVLDREDGRWESDHGDGG